MDPSLEIEKGRAQMNTPLRSIVFAAFVSVCGVPDVSGFTQSDSANEGDALRSSHAAVRIYVATDSPRFDTLTTTPNLTVSALYVPVVERMLARSSTFRRQCARIAAATHLFVSIRSEPSRRTRASALTEIQRRPGGRVDAVVWIGPSARLTELIAHEIEHIIEQLDGVDLRVRARLRDSGVRQTAESDAYETTRAVATGLRVARELLEQGP
jgi:hypothetical protein